jgi:DNA-binding transcriptional regulator LsrR (DeoR family)
VPRQELYPLERLRQIAKWFYDEGRTLEFIRDRLEVETGKGPDPRTLRKMLKQARARDVVRIEFPQPRPENRLEQRIRSAFPHLQKVIAVPVIEDERYRDLVARWGIEAARYFDELVLESSDLHVGISGGETLLTFANSVREHPRRGVHIHTTALIGRGRLKENSSHIDPLVNATALWLKCGCLPGHCSYATVPPYDSIDRSAVLREVDRFAKRPAIEAVLGEMNKISVAFVGLGLVNPPKLTESAVNQLTMTGLLEDIVSPATLAEEGALADLSCCIFDRSGETRDKWRFFLTAGHNHTDPKRRGIGFFKEMVNDRKKVIVIAGHRKDEAIRAALDAKLFNVWITDENSAQLAIRKRSV